MLRKTGRRWSFVCGDGKVLVNVHSPARECHERGCVIHRPTDPHWNWPLIWIGQLGGFFVRECPHGNYIPDADQLRFYYSRGADDVAEDVVRWCKHDMSFRSRCDCSRRTEEDSCLAILDYLASIEM